MNTKRRYEAVEAVAAHKQASARALLEPEDALGDLAEGVGIDLEQLVAGIVFKNADERLSGMAGGIQTRSRDHRPQLAPEQGDVGSGSGYRPRR